jgi:hypothetical protein
MSTTGVIPTPQDNLTLLLTEALTICDNCDKALCKRCPYDGDAICQIKKMADYIIKHTSGTYPNIPCKIGDTAWGIRHRNGKPVAASGKVSEIFFVGNDMKLCIVVSKVVRGTWGVNVFATEKEAQEAITGGLNHE